MKKEKNNMPLRIMITLIVFFLSLIIFYNFLKQTVLISIVVSLIIASYAWTLSNKGKPYGYDYPN